MNTERVNEYFRRWPKEVFVGHYEDERDPEGEEKLAFILASTREEQKEIFRRMGTREDRLNTMFPELA
jgi:hypothetical protein